MGGDVLAGTDFVDALKVFEHDDDTHGIIIVGEIGGTAEMDAAEWIKDYRRRTANPKPIMALVGGIEAPHGRIMGHAGAWTAPGEPDAQMKIKALQDAGAVIVDHPEKFGEGMKTLLGSSAKRPVFEDSTPRIARQQRGFHTLRRPQILRSSSISAQRRSLYLQQSDSFVLLKERNIPVRESNEPGAFFLGVSIDRTAHSPSFIASPTIDAKRYIESAKKFPFEYGKREFSANSAEIQAIAAHVGLAEPVQKSLSTLLEALTDIFMTKEAFSLETKVAVSSAGALEVQGARFGLEGEGTIGTLVNGAGLAMNTVDALTIRGGHCANFLDTGGKATSETMIAEGIIMAFRDLGMKVPVVVRLRGTNEELGQKMIAESKLPLHAFDSFEEAAAKVISFSHS
ncbi:succinyl-CoA ligase subunit alpha [Coccidioides immitis RMSCC 3703]|uniref:Succinyl-CoA ligase subunit alpha n=1 Tax=Coccidioides immitis RMSCC 3703 TaxID=454286 RepID=A0A0J8U142_COCIT|nr:succinyl-CoA ligase subunit alpha [Coccidioides immitis RMSCC 3703]